MVWHLPCRSNGHTYSGIYDPPVESVLGAGNKELYLPSILVKSPSIHSNANSTADTSERPQQT